MSDNQSRGVLPFGPSTPAASALGQIRILGLRVRADGPAKPARLQPCNGCGVCCALQPCRIARDYIPDLGSGPCPALMYDSDRFVCDMTRNPGVHMGLPNDWADSVIAPMFADALGVGRGCDAED
jgi:hypothetical protein